MRFRTMVCAAFLLAPSTLLAQSLPTSPIAAPDRSIAILRTGTVVPLKLTEELTTKGKQLRVGQRIHLETAEAVMIQGLTVIPIGSPAVG